MTVIHNPLTDKQKATLKRARINEIRREGAIRRQPCPKCGAQVGEQCHSEPQYWPTEPHAARKLAAGVR